MVRTRVPFFICFSLGVTLGCGFSHPKEEIVCGNYVLTQTDVVDDVLSEMMVCVLTSTRRSETVVVGYDGTLVKILISSAGRAESVTRYTFPVEICAADWTSERIYLGCYDHSVRLIDIHNYLMDELLTPMVGEGEVCRVAVCNDQVILFGSTGIIGIDHQDWINVPIDINEQCIGACEGDAELYLGCCGSVVCWDSSSNNIPQTILLECGCITSMSLDPMRKTLLVGDQEGTVLLVDLETEKEMDRIALTGTIIGFPMADFERDEYLIATSEDLSAWRRHKNPSVIRKQTKGLRYWGRVSSNILVFSESYLQYRHKIHLFRYEIAGTF